MANTHLPLTTSGSLFGSGDPTPKGAIAPGDIYDTLGVAKRSGGYELNYICSNLHGRTNMWARFKPEAIGGPAPITHAQRVLNNFGLQVTGTDYLTGAQIPRYAGPSMQTVNNLKSVRWEYKAPGASNYMRISDWLGYDTESAAPMVPPGDLSLAFGASSLQVRPRQVPIITTNLDISDFGYATQADTPLYLCVLLWESGGTSVKIFTAEHAIGSSEADRKTVVIPREAFPETLSSVNYILCLSSVRNTVVGSIPTGTFWPLPCEEIPEGTITIESDSPLRFEAECISAGLAASKDTDSINHYSMGVVQSDGSSVFHCLGLGLSSGTIVIYGKVHNDSSAAKVFTPGELSVCLQPTLHGNEARKIVPTVYWAYEYIGDDDAPEDSDSKISVPAGGSRMITLVCNYIGFGGGTPTKDYVLNASLVVFHYVAGVAPSALWSHSINISKDSDRDVTIGMGLTPIS